MQVFLFDLVPYSRNLNDLKVDGQLPYPMEKKHFDPKVAVRTFQEHLEAWVELEKLGYDGVSFNEHHATPYGLMNSPNLLAASVAQRTEKLKLLIYGNLLPLHNPLRLAEEIAMLDCLSNGRVICGVARGAAREYTIMNVPLAESRARFDECYEIMMKAWTEEVFSYEGQFHSYRDIAIWPRPVQQPAPPVWVPVSGSKDSIEWAAQHNIPITPGNPGPAREDTIRYYAKKLAEAGHEITPHHLNISTDAYVADSKEQAIEEYAPYRQYFHTLFNYNHLAAAQAGGYFQADSTAHLRKELQAKARDDSSRLREWSIEEVVEEGKAAAWGTPKEIADKIIAEAEDAGSETVLVSLNRGALPQDMFLNQIRRFGTEVLPILQKHQITKVRYA